MPAPHNPHRARLAGRLRELRAATGLSGNRFAREIGWVQSRVSKLETGAQVPSDDDLRQWSEATGGAAADLDGLRELLTRARIEYATWRDVADRPGGGLAALQAEYAVSEGRATRIAGYQPAMLPGIVQTAAYARELLGLPGGPGSLGANALDMDGLVGQRIKRQDVLYEPGRTVEIVIGEAALRCWPGTVETMVGQLDRLLTVAELAAVDIAVLRLDSPMAILPVSGFSIVDDVVYIETLAGEQRLHAPADTDVFLRAFESLRHAAARDDEAIGLVRRALARYRNAR